MANGNVPIVIPAGGSGAGLAAGTGQVFDNFNKTLRDLAFFNLAQKRQQEAFQQESLFRQQLQSQQLDARAREGQAARDQQADLLGKRQDFDAEQARLDREQRERLAKQQLAEQRAGRKERENDPIVQLGRQAQLAPFLGLDIQDPANAKAFQAAQGGNLDLLNNITASRQFISREILPILENKDLQKQEFGKRLSSKDSNRLRSLAQQAQSAPGTYMPLLEAEIAKLRQGVQEESGPGFFSRLGSSFIDGLSFLPDVPGPSSLEDFLFQQNQTVTQR